MKRAEYLKKFNRTFEDITTNNPTEYSKILNSGQFDHVQNALNYLSRSKSSDAITKVKSVIEKIKDDDYQFDEGDQQDLTVFRQKSSMFQMNQWIVIFKEGTQLDDGSKLKFYQLINMMKQTSEIKNITITLTPSLKRALPHLFSIVKHIQEEDMYPLNYPYYSRIVESVLGKKLDYDGLCQFYRTFPQKQRSIKFSAYMYFIGEAITKSLSTGEYRIEANSADHTALKKLLVADPHKTRLKKLISEDDDASKSTTRLPNSFKTMDLSETGPVNTILYGPPGTGKTYKTIDISTSVLDNNNSRNMDDIIESEDQAQHHKNTHDFQAAMRMGRIFFVTFHQNYSYEEFVGGLRPNTDGKSLAFRWTPGIFINACAKALELASTVNTDENLVDRFFEQCNSEQLSKDIENNRYDFSKKVVLIVDEINRANISRVFGELITLIEDDKRIGGEHQLILSLPNGQKFGVPKNLIILGTMNTADKSLITLDVALRRRFEFKGLYPKSILIESDFRAQFEAMNRRIIEAKGPDYQVGHSYFMGRKEGESKNDFLNRTYNSKVYPLLNEYFMGDTKKIIEKILFDQVPKPINNNGVLKYGISTPPE
jgi:hypothetical protein